MNKPGTRAVTVTKFDMSYNSLDQLPEHIKELNGITTRQPAAANPAPKPTERATINASEKDIQDAMIDLLRLSGWLVLRVNGGSMVAGDGENEKRRYVRFCYWYGPGDEADSGIPDILAFGPDGRAIMVEVKRPDKRGNLSANQQRFQAAAVAVGAEHYVLCDVEELAAVLAV